MEEEGKSWWQSRAIWGGVIAAGAGVVGSLGHMVDPEIQGSLVDVCIALGSAAGGVMAIYGRIKATRAIGKA